MYIGLDFDSSEIKPKYVPITPKKINTQANPNNIMLTRDPKPAKGTPLVSATTKTTAKPNRARNPTKIPKIEISFSGTFENA